MNIWMRSRLRLILVPYNIIILHSLIMYDLWQWVLSSKKVSAFVMTVLFSLFRMRGGRKLSEDVNDYILSTASSASDQQV